MHFFTSRVLSESEIYSFIVAGSLKRRPRDFQQPSSTDVLILQIADGSYANTMSYLWKFIHLDTDIKKLHSIDQWLSSHATLHAPLLFEHGLLKVLLSYKALASQPGFSNRSVKNIVSEIFHNAIDCFAKACLISKLTSKNQNISSMPIDHFDLFIHYLSIAFGELNHPGLTMSSLANTLVFESIMDREYFYVAQFHDEISQSGYVSLPLCATWLKSKRVSFNPIFSDVEHDEIAALEHSISELSHLISSLDVKYNSDMNR